MNRIQEIRKEKKLTQFQLSKMTGISPVCISRYENGERGLDLETAAIIATALGCKVDDLVSK